MVRSDLFVHVKYQDKSKKYPLMNKALMMLEIIPPPPPELPPPEVVASETLADPSYMVVANKIIGIIIRRIAALVQLWLFLLTD